MKHHCIIFRKRWSWRGMPGIYLIKIGVGANSIVVEVKDRSIMCGGGNLAKHSKTNNPAVALHHGPHFGSLLLVPASTASQGSEMEGSSR